MSQNVVIVSAKRTPMGALQGVLSGVSAPQLGAAAIKAAVQDATLKPEDIQEVFMGCVLSAGLGQGPARQAAIHAGLPTSVGATTVNKLCGSSMQAVMLAANAIRLGDQQLVVAGGMESMTNAPYMLAKGRVGYRMGHDKIFDHMIMDGLEDAYSHNAMGVYAENTVTKCGFDREGQDQFAIRSTERALAAVKSGHFSREIVPLEVKAGRETLIVSEDEAPKKAKIEKIPSLRPAFKEGGTVTAANSSSISDGAAALVLASKDEAIKRGLKIRAEIVGQASHAQEPEWFTLAPVGAIEKLLKKVGWSKDEVDLYEINEAFAVVTMAAIQAHGLNPEKVNVHGGACALGHPIGASGARIIVTLLHALEEKGLRRGIATLCIGGGEATAIAIERK